MEAVHTNAQYMHPWGRSYTYQVSYSPEQGSLWWANGNPCRPYAAVVLRSSLHPWGEVWCLVGKLLVHVRADLHPSSYVMRNIQGVFKSLNGSGIFISFLPIHSLSSFLRVCTFLLQADKPLYRWWQNNILWQFGAQKKSTWVVFHFKQRFNRKGWE